MYRRGWFGSSAKVTVLCCCSLSLHGHWTLALSINRRSRQQFKNNRTPTLPCARLGEKNVLSRLFIDLFVYSIDIFLFPFIYKLVVESSFIKTFLVRERLNIKKDTSKVWSGICKPSVMLSMVNKYQQSPWLCLPKVYAPPPGKWNKTIQYYAFHREILQSVIMIKLCKYRIDL